MSENVREEFGRKEYRYHVEHFQLDGKRIGGFAVWSHSMGGALELASKNIEVKLRPDQYRVTVTRLEKNI